jgi:hypothetical protein
MIGQSEKLNVYDWLMIVTAVPYLILTGAVADGNDDMECRCVGLLSMLASGREKRPALIGSAWVSCVLVARIPGSWAEVGRSRSR